MKADPLKRPARTLETWLDPPAVGLAWRAYPARTRHHPIVLTGAALILVLLLASVAGVDPRTSMLGAYLKRHGMVTWLALAVALVALCAPAATAAGRRRSLDAIPSAASGRRRMPCCSMPARIGSVVGREARPRDQPRQPEKPLGGYLAIVIPLPVWRARDAPGSGRVARNGAFAAAGSRGSLSARGRIGAGAIAFLAGQPDGCEPPSWRPS